MSPSVCNFKISRRSRSGGQIISDVLLPSWPAKLLKTHNLLRAQVPHPAVVWDEIEPLLERASTARSVQDMRGLGLVRRSTATSCRSASISASLADEDRASSAGQDSMVTSSR